ncbi:MAG: DUF4136 domain-containing protein [Planctomycetota bacterium]|jgi:hypothetical protein
MFRMVLAALAATCTACSAVRVETDYDPDAEFAGLENFAWLPARGRPAGDPRVDNALVDARVRGAVERHLAAQGYRKVSAEDADFLVAYHAAVERKLDLEALYGPYGYGPHYGAWGPGHETVVREYEEGSLLLDVLEPKRHQLIWRGSARAVVDRTATPEERSALVDKAVAKMLDRFPPQ